VVPARGGCLARPDGRQVNTDRPVILLASEELCVAVPGNPHPTGDLILRVDYCIDTPAE
jgi:hypothetical protein